MGQFGPSPFAIGFGQLAAAGKAARQRWRRGIDWQFEFAAAQCRDWLGFGSTFEHLRRSVGERDDLARACGKDRLHAEVIVLRNRIVLVGMATSAADRQAEKSKPRGIGEVGQTLIFDDLRTLNAAFVRDQSLCWS